MCTSDKDVTGRHDHWQRNHLPIIILISIIRDSSSPKTQDYVTSPPTSLARNSEMGCSSARLPCQPPAAAQLPTLDPDCTLPQDSTAPGLVPRTPENLSTLERLAEATGGTEKSWYRCVFPFGVISLVIGMAGTGVTFTFNTLLQTKVVSLVLLALGFIMLLVAAVCWRVHRARRREKKEGGFFCSEQGPL